MYSCSDPRFLQIMAFIALLEFENKVYIVVTGLITCSNLILFSKESPLTSLQKLYFLDLYIVIFHLLLIDCFK